MAPKAPDGPCGLTCSSLSVEWYGVDQPSGEHFACEWVKNPTSNRGPRKTPGGKTGLVRVCGRSSGEELPTALVKVHCCAHNPCQADWSATQYGQDPPPVFHFQPTEWRPPGAPQPLALPAPAAAAPPPVAPAPPAPAAPPRAAVAAPPAQPLPPLPPPAGPPPVAAPPPPEPEQALPPAPVEAVPGPPPGEPHAEPTGSEAKEEEEAEPTGSEAEEQEEGEEEQEAQEPGEPDAPLVPPCAAAPAAHQGAAVVFLERSAAPPSPLPGEPATAPLRPRSVAPALPKETAGLFKYGFRRKEVQEVDDEDDEEVQEVEAATAPLPSKPTWGPDRAPLNAAVAAAVPMKVLRLAREILTKASTSGTPRLFSSASATRCAQ